MRGAVAWKFKLTKQQTFEGDLSAATFSNDMKEQILITIDDVVAKYSNIGSDADIANNLRGWGVPMEQIESTIAHARDRRDEKHRLEQIASLRSALNGMSRRELIGKHLSFYSSEERIVPMLDALIEENDKDFWLIAHDNWTICERIWEFRTSVLSMFRERKERLAPHLLMPPEDQAFFNSLPDQLVVYRGCARQRARGLSWTTDKSVALSFANGIRFRPTEPVIATATINKRDIFFVTNARNESEIVLDPSKLRKLHLENA